MKKRAAARQRNRKRTDVLLIKADGFEATYVSGVLVEQGAPLRKDSKAKYFLGLAAKHNFDIRSLREVDATPEDKAMVDDQYVFPEKLSQLNGNYKVDKVAD